MHEAQLLVKKEDSLKSKETVSPGTEAGSAETSMNDVLPSKLIEKRVVVGILSLVRVLILLSVYLMSMKRMKTKRVNVTA